VRGLTAELGRPPEEIEIAQKLELPVAAFRERLAKLSFGGLISLDTTGGDGIEGLELSDESSEAADAVLLRSERRSRLADAVQQLPERLQSLLKLYYEQDYTLREIGDMLGVTESRACQLHAEAIVRLRAACAAEEEREDTAVSVRRLRATEEPSLRKTGTKVIRRAG
jgi:RNA polymerase sigma factor for flagellar operon FliA